MIVDISKLQRKIFLRVVLIAVVVVVVSYLALTLLIDGLLQAPFANSFVTFCRRILRLDEWVTLDLYQHLFRNNKAYIMFAGFFFVMLFAFYRALSGFASYFHEVCEGINALARDDQARVKLSPEMDFVEHSLEHLQNTLAHRQAEANAAEQRKNDLVVYLAHDIKTPLASVIGYLSLLEEAPDMPAEQKARYVHITLDKALRLEKLIDEFFEITRYSLQRIALDKQEIDVGHMLVQMAEEFYPVLEPDGKRLVLRVEEDLSLLGDPDRLARVFNNILRNAVAYSEAGSVIDIEAFTQAGQTVLIFQNQGPDIPAAQLEAIFEKFYRLDEARSSDSGGAGLGLAIAKEIVSLHGGSIAAESASGVTTFTVRLPKGGA